MAVSYKNPSLTRILKSILAVGIGLVAISVSRGIGAPELQERWAVVERAVDGDTVVLDTRERVRYIGIDTPELHHPTKEVQPYGREAKEFNRQLIEGRKVRLEFDVTRRDRFNRLLAYVFLEDGTFVNGELVKNGYAQLLTIPPNVKYADLFVKLQKEARENKRGLWAKKK